MKKKADIFKLLSLVGMLLGAAGTLLTSWADGRELDETISQKIDEKLADRKNEEESEES